MGKFGGSLFDKFDESVKIGTRGKDFPSGTFVAVIDKITTQTTEDDQFYLKGFWTILGIEKGGNETEEGAQHTSVYFKRAKFKFFERDTRALAAGVRGITDRDEANALSKREIATILEKEAPGTVLRIRCVQSEREPKEEGGKAKTFTNMEIVGRVGREEIMEVLEGDKKKLKKFFPQGLDAEGRGIGFGDDSDEEEAPKKRRAPAEDSDEDSDEDEE